MGTDNLHHKRKQRTINSYKRSKNRRDPYDFVLIVCEGEKSEPNYLKGLCDELQLSSANIKIIGKGADPLNLTKEALQEFNLNKDYNRIYCVFDKDQHPNYQNAITKINSNCTKKTNRVPIYSITSVPCFEYWILLHFVDSDKPYDSKQLLDDLKNYLPMYEKGQSDIFNQTKKYLQKAIDRAKKVDLQQEKNGTDNPTTKVYQLVEYLQNIKK